MIRLSLLALVACAVTGCALGAPARAFHTTDGMRTHQAVKPFANEEGPYAGRWGVFAPTRPPVLYVNARASNSWESGTLADALSAGQVAELKPVHAESCQFSLNLGLIVGGIDDSGYKKAYLNALRQGGVDALVDVRADRSLFGVLQIVWKVCTQISATGVKYVDGSPMKLGPASASR